MLFYISKALFVYQQVIIVQKYASKSWIFHFFFKLYWATLILYYFTLSNARWFYSSWGRALALLELSISWHIIFLLPPRGLWPFIFSPRFCCVYQQDRSKTSLIWNFVELMVQDQWSKFGSIRMKFGWEICTKVWLVQRTECVGYN
jgi:hypothetical protein